MRTLLPLDHLSYKNRSHHLQGFAFNNEKFERTFFLWRIFKAHFLSYVYVVEIHIASSAMFKIIKI